MKKFDYIIGNPAYQQSTDSDSTRMPPIYNYFMEEAYKLGTVVELITPARFLFDAGYTPSEWNNKMLNDVHLKVLFYDESSSGVFPGAEIKGGVVITMRDASREFGAIRVFTRYPQLNSILKKTQRITSESIQTITFPALSYGLSDTMKKEHPNSLHRLRTSAFHTLSEIFYDTPPTDGKDYVEMIGLYDKKRCTKWVDKRYLTTPKNFDHYKVFLPKSNGTGTLGEAWGPMIIAHPLLAHTQTFMSIGNFSTEDEARACQKYLKSKFLRALVSVRKVTQENAPSVWKFVPLQDFTTGSDIDWSKSIADIDQQLYKKYGLSDEEIEFIETNVKEMA